jgi:hypothetical protein
MYAPASVAISFESNEGTEMRTKVAFTSCFILVFAFHVYAQAPTTDYRPYGDAADATEDTVLGYLNALKTTGGAGFVEVFDVIRVGGGGGAFKTAGNRTIRAIKITDAAEVGGKDAYLITGCHHAREWNSVEVCLRFAKFLVENRNKENVFYDEVDVGPTPWSVASLLRRAEIIIIPVLNPDGYVYSHDSLAGSVDERGLNRTSWRKNRHKIAGTPANAVGVDLNRNYPDFWDPIPDPDRTSGDDHPELETYRGPGAVIPGTTPPQFRQVSIEVEVEAIQALHTAFKFAGVINYHSYGEDVLYPWGHTNASIPAATKTLKPDRVLKDRDYLIKVSERYTRVQPGTATQHRYTAAQSGGGAVGAAYRVSGDSDDWAYNSKKTVSVTVEVGTVFQTPKAGGALDNLYLENETAMVTFLFINSDREMRSAADIRDGRGRRPR